VLTLEYINKEAEGVMRRAIYSPAEKEGLL